MVWEYGMKLLALLNVPSQDILTFIKTRIQSWQKFTNRGNLVKPVSARFLARLGDVLGVKVLWEHDRLDAAWGRVLGLTTNPIKHESTWGEKMTKTHSTILEHNYNAPL